MLIIVGSINVVKVSAVKDTLSDYPLFKQAQVRSFNAKSDVSEQPLSIEEIIRGAKNRARNAYASDSRCHYSFGIESGLFQAPGTMTGYLEACICCIYDGKNDFTGLSCGFEVPPIILANVLDKKMDLNQASYYSGITSNDKLGAADGLVGLLTKGRINRKSYTMQAIKTALIGIENSKWYGSQAVEN